MSYEELIKNFYKSEQFKIFKENKMTQFFCEGILKEKQISLLEDNGLINLFELAKRKRKREIFSSKNLIDEFC